MQNKSSETNGAVIPYIAVLLGLLLSAGFLGWFISTRNTAEPMPQTAQEAKVPIRTKTETENAPRPNYSITLQPDITTDYEPENEPYVDSSAAEVFEEEPIDEVIPTASWMRDIHLARPASGEIIYDYSDNHPAYNETMRDWRVHNAIDIAVVPGEIATAAADGTVESIYEDRLLGNVIVLSHSGGYKTLYANLSEHALVKKGDAVKQGDSLCEIGGTAVMELFLPEHLHFALLKDDKPQNPKEHWKK